MNGKDVWAVVPIKEVAQAKQRLADAVPAEVKPRLALAMAEDVLSALALVRPLNGILVVSVDPNASELARRYGARLLAEGAREGQTGAVAAAAGVLRHEGRKAMVTIPGDVPLITAEEVARIIDAHDCERDFVIVPAHDDRGSNAVLCAPPQVVPLQFGNDSFAPHLEAAKRAGLEPKVIRLPGIGLDIDNPRDLAAFLKIPSQTRTRALLQESGRARLPS